MNKKTIYIGVAGFTLIATIFGAYWQRHAKFEEVIKDVLIDPSSAVFKNAYQQNGYYCGEVNSKNRLGGMTGFERVITDSKASFIYFEASGYASPRTKEAEGALPRLDIEIGRLSFENAVAKNDYLLLQEKGSSLSKSEREKLALKEAFIDHWNKFCAI